MSVWIVRHPLTAFFAWFFTVGQAIAFVPLVVHTGLPRQLFIIASTLVGLLLPALVISRLTGQRMRGLFAWRAAPGWYVLSLVVVPAAGLLLGVLVFGWRAGLAAAVSVFVLQLLLCLVPNNWAEEVAWTGFVQARLQHRHGPLRAALITGPLFALQHVSLVVGNEPVTGVALLLVLAVLAIPFRILTGWMWNRTGSLLLVGLLHAAGNATASGSGFGDDSLLRHLYPEHAGTVGIFHLLTFFVLGLVVLFAARARNRVHHASKEEIHR